MIPFDTKKLVKKLKTINLLLDEYYQAHSHPYWYYINDIMDDVHRLIDDIEEDIREKEKNHGE